MHKRLFAILQFCIFFGLGIFLVWWSINKMDKKNWEDCKEAMQSARYLLLFPMGLNYHCFICQKGYDGGS